MAGPAFAALVDEDGTFGVTVKLPVSRDFALVFDHIAPTGYGLGRSGWTPPASAAATRPTSTS